MNQQAESKPVFQFATGDKVRFRCWRWHGGEKVVHNARVIEVRGDGDPVIAFMEDDGAMSEHTARCYIDFVEHDPDWDPFAVKPESDRPKVSELFRSYPNDLVWIRDIDDNGTCAYYPARVESRANSWRFVRSIDGQRFWNSQGLNMCPILADW